MFIVDVCNFLFSLKFAKKLFLTIIILVYLVTYLEKMTKNLNGIVESSDSHAVIIKTDASKFTLEHPTLSFNPWDAVEFTTDETWMVSYIKKTWWEIEQVLNYFDRTGNKESSTYKGVLYKSIPIVDWSSGSIVAQALAIRGKIPGENQIADGLAVTTSNDSSENPLNSGGQFYYSIYPPFTEEQMKMACDKLAEFIQKKLEEDKNYIWKTMTASDFGFIFSEVSK